MLPPAMPSRLTTAVLKALKRARDRHAAPQMQAYMKSRMPFLGVSAPRRRRIVSEALRLDAPTNATEFREQVLELWRGAQFREERYAAVDLVLHRRHARFLDLDALPMLEELIVTGAWWDTVDGLASNAIGPLLAAYPAKMRPVLRRWSRGRDLWKRRTAILAQLRFKGDTDTALLYELIEPSLDSKEFFLQKAIGWALRQLAWSDPEEVRRYVDEQRHRLAPLSVREALKNIGGDKPAARRSARRAPRPAAHA